jgi:diadenosine tetraphosphate (Ap4A) HIT family hydrolase
MTNECPFCNIADDQIILKNETCYAIYDKYPATEGHILVIPYKHSESYFDYSKEEVAAMWELVERCQKLLDSEKSPDGYNVGINIGEAAGQTVMHMHIHIIPRTKGDMERPEGGIRHAVEGKGYYREEQKDDYMRIPIVDYVKYDDSHTFEGWARADEIKDIELRTHKRFGISEIWVTFKNGGYKVMNIKSHKWSRELYILSADVLRGNWVNYNDTLIGLGIIDEPTDDAIVQ